jgi:hypothetical protein
MALTISFVNSGITSSTVSSLTVPFVNAAEGDTLYATAYTRDSSASPAGVTWAGNAMIEITSSRASDGDFGPRMTTYYHYVTASLSSSAILTLDDSMDYPRLELIRVSSAAGARVLPIASKIFEIFPGSGGTVTAGDYDTALDEGEDIAVVANFFGMVPFTIESFNGVGWGTDAVLDFNIIDTNLRGNAFYVDSSRNYNYITSLGAKDNIFGTTPERPFLYPKVRFSVNAGDYGYILTTFQVAPNELTASSSPTGSGQVTGQAGRQTFRTGSYLGTSTLASLGSISAQADPFVGESTLISLGSRSQQTSLTGVGSLSSNGQDVANRQGSADLGGTGSIDVSGRIFFPPSFFERNFRSLNQRYAKLYKRVVRPL